MNLEIKRRNKRTDIPKPNLNVLLQKPSESDSDQSSVIEFHIDDLAQLTKPLERYRPSSRSLSMRQKIQQTIPYKQKAEYKVHNKLTLKAPKPKPQ